MPEQPGREPRGRVGHAVTDGLRSCGHHRDVRRVAHLGGGDERLEDRALLLGESGGCGPPDGYHCGHFGRYGSRQADMDAEQSLRGLPPHRVAVSYTHLTLPTSDLV